MAVTPSSLTTLSTEEQALVAKAEAAIDAELRLKYEVGKPVYIRNAILRDVYAINIRAMDALKALYTASGWNIVEYDSSEGKWLSFSEQ